jgi:transposase
LPVGGVTDAAGMAKSFRSWELETTWLFPPSVLELVPPEHLAHFVREVVHEEIDLTPILATYTEERGQPPYHPALMTALLLYAYTQGIYSSRRIEKACIERLDFMAVTAMAKPDHSTVAEFRRRHRKALAGLFVEVLQLCREAGLVSLGHVALDGTKVKANASKHKAMSYGRMKEVEPKLVAEVEEWLRKAEQADDEDDDQHGKGRRGGELPDWVANRQRRLEKIREAKQRLEEQAKADAQLAKAVIAERRKRGDRTAANYRSERTEFPTRRPRRISRTPKVGS